MESLFIRDFRRGLDTRRSELTQLPGSLEVLTNGFINQGGEIENRKAFVRTAQIANSFGLQPTASGLLTFGSANNPGGYPLNIGTVGVPIQVNYQQLKHPQDLFDGTTNVVPMTEVVHSTEFRGKAWVIAKFGSSGTFGYYDGTLVYDFTNGLVMSFLNTNVELATWLTQMINRTAAYTAVQLANPNDNQTNLTGPVGTLIDVVAEDTSSAGTLGVTKTSDPTNGSPLRQAIGGFSVVAGSATPGTSFTTTNRARTSNVATITIGTHTILVGTVVSVTGLGGTGYNQSNVTVTAVSATTISYANTGSDEGTTADVGGTVTLANQIVKVEVGPAAGPLVTITNGSVNWATSNELTAAAIAASINTLTSTPDYVAEASGNLITIKALLADGDSSNDYVVQVSCAGNVCIGRVEFQAIRSATGTFAGCTNVTIAGTNVLSAAVAFTSTTQIVSDIAADINDDTETHGYVACAIGSSIFFSKAITRSDDPPLPIFVTPDATGTGNGIFEVGQQPTGSGLAVTIATTGVSQIIGGGQPTFDKYSVLVIVTSGTPPYQEPVWNVPVKALNRYTDYVVMTRVTAASWILYVRTGLALPQVYCQVTDAALATAKSNNLAA